MSEALRSLLEADAEQIAQLARRRRGERADRLAARALLMRVFAALAPAEVDDAAPDEATPSASAEAPALSTPTRSRQEASDPLGQGASADELTALAVEAATLRLRLEGPGWRALAPIGEVWIRTPYPQVFMRPVCATGAQRLARQRDDQFSLKLALSEERIAWMEERCTAAQPGLLRPVRVAESGQGARHGASELELLRKRGRAKVS